MRNRTKMRIIAAALICALLMPLAALAEQVYVQGTGKVYGKPGASKAALTLPAGTTVELVAQKSGWAMVTKSGKTGYMRTSDLAKAQSVDNLTAYTRKSTTLYGSSSGGKKLATIPAGKAVTVTMRAGEIAKVSYDGNSGYVKIASLTTKAPAQSSFQKRKVYAAKDGVKVYNSKRKVIATLSANTALTLTGLSGSVASVEKDGVTGYMSTGDLSDSPVTVAEAPKAEPAAPQETTQTAYVRKTGAKYYNASGKALGTLAVNTKLTVTVVSGELCRVTNGSVTAYMKKSDLSAEPIEVFQCTTAYVKNDGAKVYNASGKAVGTLALNTQVTVTAIDGSVCAVTGGGKSGYMYATDLSCDKVTVALKYGDKGENVEKLQARLKALGYFSGTVGGNYLDLTRSAVASFQSVAKLSSTGVADVATLTALFSDDAPKKPAAATTTVVIGTSKAVAASGSAIEMDWWTSDIQKIFSRGTVVTVTDVATGLAWQEKRYGGSKHADCEPLTAADTANMKKAYGGSWSWNRRAVFVTINGVNYAASINGMPHGGSSISGNNFSGHHCIHFTNSRTHGTDRVCPLHQAAIKKAAAALLN